MALRRRALHRSFEPSDSFIGRELGERVQRSRKNLSRLYELLRQTAHRIEELRRRGVPRRIVYNYIVLWHLLNDVLKYAISGVRRMSAKTTFILPGALWIVKCLLHGRMSIDDAATCIGSVRSLARKLFRILVFDKNLTFVIPSNLSPKDVKVFLWVDKVGYDVAGNPLYVLTMYTSFPFDISEHDGRSEYEPISFLFVKRGRKFVPVKAFARVHYDIYVYDLSNIDTVAVLFMRYGHTPKVLNAEVSRYTEGNPLKAVLDYVWIHLGDALTKLLGVETIRLRDDPSKIHVYVVYKLAKTVNNPFVTAIHPYFVDVSLRV